MPRVWQAQKLRGRDLEEDVRLGRSQGCQNSSLTSSLSSSSMSSSAAFNSNSRSLASSRTIPRPRPLPTGPRRDPRPLQSDLILCLPLKASSQWYAPPNGSRAPHSVHRWLEEQAVQRAEARVPRLDAMVVVAEPERMRSKVEIGPVSRALGAKG